MHYDRSIIPVIETAHARNPVCRACGTPTTIRSEDDVVLVECGAAQEPRGRIGRILYAMSLHDRVQVLP